MYLAVCTQPNIASALISLSRFNSDAGPAHWEGVLRVLLCIQGPPGEGILYEAGSFTDVWGN